jgi:hypothetical protein
VVKLCLAFVPVALGLALPAAYAVSGKSRPRTIEHALLREMNSSGDGTITRRVRCTPVRDERGSFACRLTSVRSTTLDADVEVVDGGLRTVWHPLDG